MKGRDCLPAIALTALLLSSVPMVFAGPPAGQSALDWFLLYLPYMLGVIAIIIIIIYAIREERKPEPARPPEP